MNDRERHLQDREREGEREREERDPRSRSMHRYREGGWPADLDERSTLEASRDPERGRRPQPLGERWGPWGGMEQFGSRTIGGYAPPPDHRGVPHDMPQDHPGERGAGPSFRGGSPGPAVQRDEGSFASAYGGWAGRDRDYTGRGPKGYTRSDDRIREEVCDRLTQDPHVDPSEVRIEVASGEVTLEGHVDRRAIKHRIEDTVAGVTGVKEIHNRIRVLSGPGGGESDRMGD